MTQAAHIVPFTPNGRRTELLATRVKHRLGVAPEDPLDPFAALPAIPARLVAPEIILNAAPAAGDVLFRRFPDEWSAVGFGRSPLTGEVLILLNPTHHRHRQRVSLMEEEVHIVLGHTKTLLHFDTARRRWIREYHGAIEDEAYSVGAACILPYPLLVEAVQCAGEAASVIAERFDVSEQYVAYRIKRAGLWQMYTAGRGQQKLEQSLA